MMSLHDLLTIVDILNRILGLIFYRDVTGWYALCNRQILHHVGLDKPIVRSSSSKDQVRSNARPILANSFQSALPLLR